MRRIFWDTMLFVYFLEEHPQYSSDVQNLFERTLIAGDRLLTSSLAYGEALVGIVRLPEPQAKGMRQMLSALPFELIDFDRNCLEPFATLRNRGIRPPDAINLSCAMAAQADIFVTNDSKLRLQAKTDAPRVLTISETMDSF